MARDRCTRLEVFFVALAYNFIDEAFNSDHGEKSIGVGGFVSANGSFSRDRPAVQSSSGSKFITVLRDVAAIAALGCAVGAFLFESFRMDALTFRHELEGIMGQNWKTGQWRITLGQGAVVTIVGTVNCVLTVLMLQRRGALNAGFIGLGGAMCANLVTAITAFRSYFTFISAAAIYSYLSGPGSSNYGAMESRRTMRRRQFITLVSLLSFGVWIVLLLSRSHASGMMKNGGSFFPINSSSPPSEPPNHPSISNFHPINQLINHAEKELDNVKSRQSKSLEEAVTEYRRRYGLPPPPNFDKWYEFAVKNGVQLIDEYDTIHDSLLPFWALDPSIIRSRVREALGFDNALMGMSIRAGQPVLIEKGPEWQQKATVGIMKAFVNHLPDMDLAFNLHDEPRVVVPHEELSKLVSNARNTAMPAAFANKSPQNSFSKRPSDMNDGRKMAEFQITRFNKYAHQPTWLPSKLSCPPESPARAISETAQDNLTSYALGDLGFVFNVTAFSDICESPSLRQTYGFFDRPNAFNIVHDLFPIFSQSKVSSFQDILYPSPWYWYGKVMYEADKDMEWTDKATKMYWRGSTTGGFSRDGGWRRQHRQKVIQKMNAPDEAKILENNGDEGSPAWHVKEVPRQDYKDLFDVRFSHVGQCDPNDCDAQKEFFDIAETAGQQDAWASKFLLDIDGNAFSGRFYAFLKSKSLVYKLAVFREWHQEWLRPWAHYVPLSLRGDEFVESVRYFANETDGDAQARWIAFQGSDWADKVLRNVDFEAWFFRLLLEYGRVIDDHRELIGYAGP
ncbi:MAG: capsule-associated protein CAP1 [Sclerophora amabilis]|nr:MAG: capsule-associated protein CAP1 [Sclerophora amabilis]